MKKSVTPDRSSAENPVQGRILGAAFNAFTQDGYAGTSTLEIARRAKVSKRDLYANFSSKHAVLVACIMSRADRMRLPPDLPTPQSRRMLASTLTGFCDETAARGFPPIGDRDVPPGDRRGDPLA
jgi:AcrR family transcriptional regulator